MAKLSEKYEIEKRYIRKGNARSGKRLSAGDPRFFVAHETANNTADEDDHFDYFNDHQPSASAQTFIGAIKILEIIPVDQPEKAWHVMYKQDRRVLGLGFANDHAIGVELCRTGSFAKAYDRYVWYFAYLCRKFGKDPRKHIIDHKSLDPERRRDPHSWLNPNGVTWAEFISDVVEYYENWHKEISETVDKGISKPSKPAPVAADKDTSDEGKRVESIHKDKNDPLVFRSKPSWDDKDVVGTFGYGMGWTIVEKVTVGRSPQYKVKNSKGSIYYITAAPEFVKVVEDPKRKLTEFVHLPASAETWGTYELGVQPVSKNISWSLTPARYGGLTYEVLDEPWPNVVTIMTGRGKRNIFVDPSRTSARRYKK